MVTLKVRKKYLIILLIISIIGLVGLTGCSTVRIIDTGIHIRYYKKGEVVKIPYNGVLLNKSTFYKLIIKAREGDK